MEIKKPVFKYLRKSKALHSMAPGAVGWITTFTALGITLNIVERVAVGTFHVDSAGCPAHEK